MARLNAELREQVRAARDRAARDRSEVELAGRRARLERTLTVTLAERCSWPAVPGFDVAAHLSGVAGVVVGAHEAGT